MLVLDRVLCDCCGDDMGQLNGGVCTRPGVLADMTKPPYFAVCPECYSDAAYYLGLVPVPHQIGADRLQPPCENGNKQEAA